MRISDSEKFEAKVIAVSDLIEGINRANSDDIDLVVVKRAEEISVFSGICLHAGAFLANGFIEGDHLVCGSHLWRYHLKTGELIGEPGIFLKKLTYVIEAGIILVKQSDLEELIDEDDY